jgi:two-component system NtrC family response regulator
MHLPDRVRVEAIRRQRAGESQKSPPAARPAPGPEPRLPEPEAPGPLDTAALAAALFQDPPQPWKAARSQAVEAVERAYLAHLMEHAEGNAQRACALSGLSQSRLYELLRKHGLETG